MTIDQGGHISFVDAATGTNKVTFTATIGRPISKTIPFSQFVEAVNGTQVRTANEHHLEVGDSFSFDNLEGPTGGLKPGPFLYYVKQVLDAKSFEFTTTPDGDAVRRRQRDQRPGRRRGHARRAADAGGGGFPAGRQNQTQVTTTAAHGLKKGDPVFFQNLQNPNGLANLPGPLLRR